MGESCFQVSVFLVRLSGIPINMKRVSRLKPLCNARSKRAFSFNFFDVLLTVHLSIILVINQLNAQILVL